MNRRNVEAFRKLGRAVEMRAKFGGPGVACGVERNIIVLVNILRAYLVSDARPAGWLGAVHVLTSYSNNAFF
jgi:hypothetical protein